MSNQGEAAEQEIEGQTQLKKIGFGAVISPK